MSIRSNVKGIKKRVDDARTYAEQRELAYERLARMREKARYDREMKLLKIKRDRQRMRESLAAERTKTKPKKGKSTLTFSQKVNRVEDFLFGAPPKKRAVKSTTKKRKRTTKK